MLVSFNSLRTLASITSTSSLDHPRPFSSLGRVRTARLITVIPVRELSKVQMPCSSALAASLTNEIVYK